MLFFGGGHKDHQINSKKVQHTGQLAKSKTMDLMKQPYVTLDSVHAKTTGIIQLYTNYSISDNIMKNQFKSRNFSLRVSRFIQITHLSTFRPQELQSYVQYKRTFITICHGWLI